MNQQIRKRTPPAQPEQQQQQPRQHRRRQRQRKQQYRSLVMLSTNILFLATLCLLLLAVMPTSTVAGFKARHCGGSLRHVHLAVGHDPASQMTVSFSSRRSFETRLVGGVLIGTHPDALDIYIEEQAPARYYNATPVRESHGHYYSPYLHHVRLSDLDPSTTYYYKCVTRKLREAPPIPRTTPAALRGNYPGQNDGSSYVVPLAEQQTQEVMRAEEREQEVDDDGILAIDDEGEEGTGHRGRQRRYLALEFYDSTRGECPPPNKIRQFATAPEKGTIGKKQKESSNNNDNNSHPEDPTLKFAYIGDIGQFEHSLETIRHLTTHQRSKVSAVMLAGDIAYTGYDNRRFDTWFDFMDDHFMIDEIPMQICAGNHDIEKHENDGDIFLAYENRFDMPQVKPAQLGTYQGPLGYLNMDVPDYPMPYEYGNAYYAFSYGISHHIFLNAYSAMEPNSTQYQWLVQELKAVDRSVTPWLIVTIHVPVYNAFSVHHHDPQIFAAKEHFEALYVEYKVNLVVSGHVHAYQRTKNVAFDVEVPTGPVHVIIGAGGRQCHADFRQEEPEEWLEVRDGTRYGYGTLEIFNQTHAQWEWIITGENDSEQVNRVHKTNITLPRLQESDALMLENQFFL